MTPLVVGFEMKIMPSGPVPREAGGFGSGLGYACRMLRRIYNALTVAGLLYLAVMAVLVVGPSFFDPQFDIRNRSGETVSVVAVWRDKKREFVDIAPSGRVEFSVSDEAGMSFRVRYPDGREIASEPVYFTLGTTVIATINADDIDVRYDHDL